MMRFVLTGIALSSVALATGVLETSVLAQNPISSASLGRQATSSAAYKTAPIKIAQVSTTSSLDSLEQAFYSQINQYRTNHGLPALTLDSRISEQARTHSQNMASGAVPFSHNGFTDRVQAIAKVIPYSAAAENVAYNQGYRDPVSQAVKGLLNSPGHLANIEGKYNLTGVGVAKNANGAYYFTQIFIRSR